MSKENFLNEDENSAFRQLEDLENSDNFSDDDYSF